ncbi:uncharacterized protein THITE_112766 [Thermothielavioides terrestris NRRL 8126]|uniref:Ubiquitin-like protease family profile domain-containing protein n=1 Tax=Thermothielavioides terrestris (strain ATCC 38088 / NRRL 8126) TaxID=578455 RepID=G2QW64_THETT|nr:uncharacterized protein THITE_112766 [Thermothielavioides terrestris NRRL 8126]AEO63039.1 hypothetical protein THITE_112766 [Thermothielavioides terrestris NRRL 8126]
MGVLSGGCWLACGAENRQARAAELPVGLSNTLHIMASKSSEMDFLNDYDGGKSPQAAQHLQLPTHRDFAKPLSDDQLHDATDPQFDRECRGSLSGNRPFLDTAYRRVAHPALDEAVSESNRLAAWRSCHNGLFRARHGEWLDGEDVYYLANRLLTWCQEQRPARLGSISQGKWWILPEHYNLLVRDPTAGGWQEEAPELGSGHYSPGAANLHKKAFDNAKITVHFVHFSAHWAVLFYRRSTGQSWYIDSMPEGAAFRSRQAREALRDWLQRSGRPIPDPKADHFLEVNPEQEDEWSCGIHVIANAMAFIRFEAIGWHRIPEWRQKKSKEVRKALVTCLHQLMGLKIDPEHKSPGSAKRAKKRKRVAGLRSTEADSSAATGQQAGPQNQSAGQQAGPQIQPSPKPQVVQPRQKTTTPEKPPARRPPTQPSEPQPAAPPQQVLVQVPETFGVRRAPPGRALVRAIRARAARDVAARLAQLRTEVQQRAAGFKAGEEETELANRRAAERAVAAEARRAAQKEAARAAAAAAAATAAAAAPLPPPPPAQQPAQPAKELKIKGLASDLQKDQRKRKSGSSGKKTAGRPRKKQKTAAAAAAADDDENIQYQPQQLRGRTRTSTRTRTRTSTSASSTSTGTSSTNKADLLQAQSSGARQ